MLAQERNVDTIQMINQYLSQIISDKELAQDLKSLGGSGRHLSPPSES